MNWKYGKFHSKNVQICVMTWNDILTYEIFHFGSYKLEAGNLFVAGIILAATLIFLMLLRRVIERPKVLLSNIDKKRRHSIYLLAKYFVWVIAFVLILEALGVKVSILLAGSAALLVGIGFGLQPIFADLVSGLFLLFEGTIKIGDVIETEGIVGKVSEINLRSSELVTRDNVVMIIPNSKFVTEKVINWSHNTESVRFLVAIGVAYGSDVERVIEVLQSVMDEHDLIEKSPQPFVRFINFGESSLDFQLFFWTKETFTVENLKSDIRRTIHRRLKEEKIAIPYPQRDIHIISKKED